MFSGRGMTATKQECIDAGKVSNIIKELYGDSPSRVRKFAPCSLYLSRDHFMPLVAGEEGVLENALSKDLYSRCRRFARQLLLHLAEAQALPMGRKELYPYVMAACLASEHGGDTVFASPERLNSFLEIFNTELYGDEPFIVYDSRTQKLSSFLNRAGRLIDPDGLPRRMKKSFMVELQQDMLDAADLLRRAFGLVVSEGSDDELARDARLQADRLVSKMMKVRVPTLSPPERELC